MGRSDEVEDREAVLAVGSSQATTELLKEDSRALGRSQEEHGVDIGKINAFVEQIHAEDTLDVTQPKRLEACPPFGLGGLCGDCDRSDPRPGQLARHELGV